MTVRLALVNLDPEPGDAAAATAYVRLTVVDAGADGPDPAGVDVRVFRAQPVSAAVADGDSVVLTFAAPHGLGPSAVASSSVTAAPLSASPTHVTTASPHGLVSGQRVLVSGARGNVAVNGEWPATVTGANTFTVPVAGVAAYLGGGSASGPVGQGCAASVANVVGFGTGVNGAKTVTVVDALRVRVPCSPPAGSAWLGGGTVTPAPRAVAGATGNGVTPVVLTFAAPHGLGPVGAPVAAYVSDVRGNLAANGDWPATVTSPTAVSLPTTGSGAYAGPPGTVVVGTMPNLALHAGAVQAGWGGTSALAPLDPGTLVVSLVPNVPLASDAPHLVRVVADTVGDTVPPLVTLYSFTTLDDLPPAVLGAVAPDRSTVQVSFYEAVLQSDPAGASDALNPSNYALSVVHGLPAVTPAVVSAARGYAPSIVALSLSAPMTGGATYRVVVSGVVDLGGNAAAPPTNAATFTGWRSSAPGRSFDLWGMWPDVNKLEDATGELRGFVACFQEVADLVLGEVDGFLDVLDPDVAPAAWLPSMLADQGNPFGALLGSLAPDDLRRLSHALVPVYRLKGTDPGIVQALNFFLGVTAAVSYEAAGGPGLGDASVSGPGPDQGGPAGEALRLGTDDPRERMTFFVDVPGGLTAGQSTAGRAVVQYMRRAGTRPVWRPPQPAPPAPPDPLGEFQLGPGGTWHLV